MGQTFYVFTYLGLSHDGKGNGFEKIKNLNFCSKITEGSRSEKPYSYLFSDPRC